MADMQEMIAYCGITCSDCPAFLATMKDDDNERKNVAASWSKEFNADIKPEDINCEGCLSTSTRVFSHCNVCEIRKCGQEKGLQNCASCDEYVCERLDKFLKMVPVARATLDRIKAEL
jgi:hypothetical protein